MDAVQRQFAALAEADGRVTIRYHLRAKPDDVAERQMTYRQYMTWLAQAHTNGFVLERVESERLRDAS